MARAVAAGAAMIGRLLCRAGWHAPVTAGRWNQGYCFTRCRRCGRDLVRSAFGEWHVPRGFRVVWGPKGSVADLDQVLAVEDISPSTPVAPTPPSSQQRRPEPPRVATPSPFDFGDFEQAEDRGRPEADTAGNDPPGRRFSL